MHVTDTDNKDVPLTAFRGRPTLVVYEDRDHTQTNQAFKDHLFEEAKKKGLLNKVNLVAVAYLKPFDFFPAKQFALNHVRGIEEKLGIPIYVDFTGNVAQGLRLPTDNSTIVLLDRKGDVVFRYSGKLRGTPAEVRFNEVLDEVSKN